MKSHSSKSTEKPTSSWKDLQQRTVQNEQQAAKRLLTAFNVYYEMVGSAPVDELD